MISFTNLHLTLTKFNWSSDPSTVWRIKLGRGVGKLCFGVDSEGVFDFPIFAKNLILFFEIIMTLASTCSSLDACLKVTELLWHDSNLNTLCLDISWFAVNKNKDWIWLFLSVLFLYFLYFQVDTKNYKKVILFFVWDYRTKLFVF